MNDSQVSTEDDIHHAQQGDREAFCRLVRTHRQGMVNLVFRMTGDMHLAEDVAQDAFIRAWQYLKKYQPSGSFRSWLYRIAVNITVDTIRGEKEALDIDEMPLCAADTGLEDQSIRRDRAEMVQAAVLRLAPAARAVLVLREYEGCSYQEIAGALGIPLGTVMSRLSYARRCLAVTLAPLMEER